MRREAGGGGGRSIQHDIVGAFHQHPDLAGRIANDGGHPLPCRREGVHCQHRVLSRGLGRSAAVVDLHAQRMPGPALEVPTQLAHSFDESALVGAFRLVLLRAPLVLGDHHRMRNGKNLQEGVDGIRRPGAKGSGAAHVGGGRKAPALGDLAIDQVANGHPFQVHHILCQRARFVGENVRHLAQLVAEVRRPDKGGAVLLLVVHFEVILQEKSLRKVAHFHCGVQRDRHQIRKQHKEGEPRGRPTRENELLRLPQWVQVPQAEEVV
mmetsp:Transcript_100403/g.289979  ORF Transcript_100403/g.289979 Transcript_100403/m.289979 type:complete len:266 (+) Transcript_100403:673-1470(+)